MFKRFVLCLLVPFLFSSCEDPYLDMNVYCELDKLTATYEKDEPITVSYYGSFGDSSDIGSLRILFYVYKITEGKSEKYQKLNFPESDSLYFVYYNDNDGSYYVDIKEDEKMTDFDDSTVLIISEAGNYELSIAITGSSEKHPHTSLEDFTFPIKITE